MWTSLKQWNKIQAQDEKELKKIEREKKRYERRQDRQDAKALRRYEKVLEKGMRIKKSDWL